MAGLQEIERAQTLKEQTELREQAQKAEAFIAANIIILEAKFALEDTPEFVAVRPENFWDDTPFKRVEFEKDTYYSKKCKLLIAAVNPNWLTITTNPNFSDHDRVECKLQAIGQLSHPAISITTCEFGHMGGSGPNSDNGVGWAFLNARLLLASWFGKINPTDVIMPFWKEEDLSLANILAKTQRVISSNDSR